MSVLGLNNPQQGTSTEGAATAVAVEKARYQMVIKGSSSWFVWLAGLSLLNSIFHLSGIRFQFIFGLGIAQLVDMLARRLGGASFVLDLIINGFLAAVFLLFFNFARRGQKWAFIVGMSLYALDGLLMLGIGALLAAGFHALALFFMFGGIGAINKLRELEEAAPTPPAQLGMFPRG
jgi:hypothetical protein